MNVKDIILNQFESRTARGGVPSYKINLYKGYEVAAVAIAIDELREYGEIRYPDCIMVADSYLCTHLKRRSTVLSSHESDMFLRVFLDLVHEVRIAMGAHLPINNVYLLADMPDGTHQTKSDAEKNAELMLAYGADAVKIEVTSQCHYDIIEHLSSNGIITVAHLGYTPQMGENRVYGRTLDEARHLFASARRCRDSGASALVLERVCEPVNQALCNHHPMGLPIYSIFSGKTNGGGQSLNVWDAVIKPPFKAVHFPPTATMDKDEYPSMYSVYEIALHFKSLLKMTLSGTFPKPLSCKMAIPDMIQVKDMEVW